MKIASDENVNICFDCANAYAHKCEYIRNREHKRIKKCEYFVPDYIAKGITAILKYLDYPRYQFAKIGDRGLRRAAKEKGCRLDIIENENGRKHYYLRLIKK